jgi:L-threonylcarbamoyladenylate synthase
MMGGMGRIVTWSEAAATALIDEVRSTLAAGQLAALPTETFYALAAHPFDEAALRRLFAAKGRAADKPVLVLVSGPEMLRLLTAAVPKVAALLMDRFWPGPLTILLSALPGLPRALTAGTGAVGVRQPAHRAVCRLIAALGWPVTGTSANRAGEPALTRAAEVNERLGREIALIVDTGPCPGGLPSTIVDATQWPPRLVRAGAIPAKALLPLMPDLQTEGLNHE